MRHGKRPPNATLRNEIYQQEAARRPAAKKKQYAQRALFADAFKLYANNGAPNNTGVTRPFGPSTD